MEDYNIESTNIETVDEVNELDYETDSPAVCEEESNGGSGLIGTIVSFAAGVGTALIARKAIPWVKGKIAARKERRAAQKQEAEKAAKKAQAKKTTKKPAPKKKDTKKSEPKND